MAAHPVNQSVREIDQDSWLLGDRFTLSRTDSPVSDISWGTGNGSFYNLATATQPLPQSRALAETSHIPKVHDAGGASAVWLFGEAVVKVKVVDPRATREHVTLNYICSKRPNFEILDVLFQTDFDGRYYIVQQKLPGRTLASLWPTLNDLKQEYASRIAGVCEELGAYLGDGIHGVDGNHLADLYLSPRGSRIAAPLRFYAIARPSIWIAPDFTSITATLGLEISLLILPLALSELSTGRRLDMSL